jgi:hypothetical protein
VLDHTVPTNVGDRSLAGFTPREIAETQRLERELAGELERSKQEIADASGGGNEN